MQRSVAAAEITNVVDTSFLVRPALPQPALRHVAGYELLERVGRGASAEVWLARRPIMPGALKPCALKIMHARVGAQARHRRMFLQEARLALSLSHANLVSVFDVGEADGRLYMALEWVDGVHLRHFAQHVHAQEGDLRIAEICHIVGELLHGLRYAHELSRGGRPLGVVHRDIAPHNVLVSAAGEVKLGDFGIARVGGELSSGEHVKGRARYMAPEQLLGEPTQASDMFAVGAILHELLEGRRFREGFERSPDWHRVVAEARLLPLRRRDVPPELEALRVGLLQPDPERRIASPGEALDGLVRCPPWPPGAVALRGRYARCVGVRRRSGLTRFAPPVQGQTRPRIIDTRSCSPDSGRTPSATATLRDRGTRVSSGPSAEAVVHRRTAAPLRPQRRSRRLRWVGHALWALAGLFGALAVGLLVVATRAETSACIHETAVPPDRRARLRLRSDALPRAQVRIDMQILEVAARRDCSLSPGVHELSWRHTPERPWSSPAAHLLAPAREHLIVVGEDGLSISAYDP